jgi:autotransporter translocation and assembly factor TamB
LQLITGKIRFLLVFFLFLIITAFIWGYFFFPSSKMADRIRVMIEEELSRLLCAEAQVKAVGLFCFAPEFREVEIRTATNEPILTARKIRLGLDWVKMLTTRSLEESLRNLDLIETTVWLWDTISLFDSDEGGGLKPWFTIRLFNCQLVMEEAGKEWAWGNFHHLNGLVDFRSYPAIQVNGKGQSSLDPKATAAVDLYYTVEEKQGTIQIEADRASASLWGEKLFQLLGYDHEFKVLAGELKGEVSLLLRRGQVNLDRTRLEFTASRWQVAALPYPLVDLNADVTVSSTGVTVQNFQGRYREGQISLYGSLAATSLGLDLNLEATGQNLADWTSLIPQLAEWAPAGLVDLNLQIAGEISAPHLAGEVRIMNGRLALPQFSVTLEDLRLFARLSSDGVHLSFLEGRIGEAPFFLQGEILGVQDPTLNLQGEIKQFPIEKLNLPGFPPTRGLVEGAVHVSGRLSAPEIKGELSADQLMVEGTALQELKLAGIYRWPTDQLKIDRLTVKALDGEALATGELLNLTGQPSLWLETQIEGVDLAQLPPELLVGEKPWPALAGTAGLKLRIGGPLFALSGEGELTVANGRLDRHSFERLQLLLSGDQERLTVRATLKEKEGTMIATGSVQPESGDFEGDLLLRGLSVDEHWLPPSLAGLSGKLNGLLHGRGNWAGNQWLQGEGWLEVHDLDYNGQELGVLKLQGEVGRRQLTLKDSFLLTPAGQIRLTGFIDWQDNPCYNLTADGADLLFEDLASLLPAQLPVALAGLTDFRLKVQGWEKPVLSGAINGKGITLNGYYLGAGNIDFRWEAGVLHLNELLFGANGLQLRSAGKISAGRELDLEVAAKNFPLTALPQIGGEHLADQQFLKKITGKLTGHGKLRGSLTDPVFAGQLSVDDPVIAGFALDRIAGELSWEDRNLCFDELLIKRGQEELTVYGRVDWTGAEPYLDLGLKMDGTGLADLLLLTGKAPNLRLDGDVTGYLRLFGALAQPQIRLITQIENGEINGFTPLNGELDLLIHDGQVTVNRLLLDDGQGELFASIVYTPGRQLEITAHTRDFSLAPLIALTGRKDLAATGRFNSALALTTTAAGMQGEFAALLKDTTWGNFSVASLSLNGRISDDLVFLEAEDLITNRLSIQGSVPLNPVWFGNLQLPTTWPHRSNQIDLGLSAERIEASALNTFFKEPVVTDGTIDGLISLNGTWQKPYLVGMMSITGGRGKIPALAAEFKEINGILSFSDQGLELRGLSNKEGSYLEGRLGSGRFRLGGRVISDGLRPEGFDLRLLGVHLHLSTSFFDGLVDGELTLTGPFTQATLSGEATVQKARIEVPEGTSAALPFDLNLDLQCEAANDVYFRMYGMAYIPFNGRLQVGGCLRKPEINGELISTRGWVNILGDTFRVKTLRAEFRPDYKLYPYLELEATHFLAGTEVTVNTEGWLGDLESLVLNLTSNPVKSREEIIKILNWPEKIEDGDLTFATMFQENINMVGDLFIGRFLDQFRSVMPIDFLTLEQDRQEGTFWMNMGKSLSEDLYLSYSRSLTSLAEQVWTLEWKLLPNFSLLGDYSVAEGIRWQFQYNLRF